ncbi:YCII-related domain protein [Yersinia ruckeri]|uniref:YciI family protein n=1 Tax=Yersinia ruckeri TaxID=29486 RepID=UPI0005AC27D1|nr:YciI family protein [Yersinia ruckeri]AJI94608.1 YCII-related domain protein [Yersinia ruckeri]MCW6568545.1 YciI family protein [Yersinia ruckeri]
MYIINLTYHRPVEEVDVHLDAHIAWLHHYYAQGIFLASGRKNPRTGGVIFAIALPRDELDAILAEDPFNAVAHYDVIEFTPTITSDSLTALKGL